MAKRQLDDYARHRGASPDFRFGRPSPRPVVANAADQNLPRAHSSVSVPRAASLISLGSPMAQHRQVSRTRSGNMAQAVSVQAPQTARAASVQRSSSCVTTSSSYTSANWASPRKPPHVSAQAAPAQAAPSESPLKLVSPPLVPTAMGALVGCSGPDRRTVGGNRGLPGMNTPLTRFRTDRPPISGARPSRSREVPDAKAQDGRYTFQAPEEVPEFSEPSSNLPDLLAYLDRAGRCGKRIVETTYCVNTWKLYGFIPLKHHGFILRFEAARPDPQPRYNEEDEEYLTLDFSTKGILWDTFEVYPDVPEGTIYTKQYSTSLDPMVLRRYCKNTKQFSWPDNDCKNWAKGVLALMGVADDPYTDASAMDKLTRGDVRMRDIITCGARDGPRIMRCM